MELDKNFWKGRSVFLTGHTGFKGGWISVWLSKMGAKVHGYSLKPPEGDNFFKDVGVSNLLSSSVFGDIRNLELLKQSIFSAKPSIVIHMAAQPLVRKSYTIPQETFATNLIGTVNLLETVRCYAQADAVLNVTTDKCYKNKEWVYPYRESDELGGFDPYSSSKACAEIAASAYQSSFFQHSKTSLACARAGNVIGGGDWAKDRLVPDFFRAIKLKKEFEIRSPDAIRPWQHVLEPLSGYLKLLENLTNFGAKYTGSWNFGPDDIGNKSVLWIVKRLSDLCAPELKLKISENEGLHESKILKLDSSKVKEELGWVAKWKVDKALEQTANWYNSWIINENLLETCCKQIDEYSSDE